MATCSIIPLTLILVQLEDRKDKGEEELEYLQKALTKWNLCTPKTVKDPTRHQMLNEIGQVSSQSTLGCFVFVLSHGSNGAVNDVDGVPVSLQEILDQMRPAATLSNPQILVIQACQDYINGEQCTGPLGQIDAKPLGQRHAGNMMHCYHVDMPHMALIKSSLPGEPSHRHEFIQDFADVLDSKINIGSVKLTDLFTEANMRLGERFNQTATIEVSMRSYYEMNSKHSASMTQISWPSMSMSSVNKPTFFQSPWRKAITLAIVVTVAAYMVWFMKDTFLGWIGCTLGWIGRTQDLSNVTSNDTLASTEMVNEHLQNTMEMSLRVDDD